MSKTQIFIEKARAVHGDRYDYSKVDYAHSKRKVFIFCGVHGYFLQTPTAHLNGSGCAKCSFDAKRLTADDFAIKGALKHGDKYGYSEVDYVDTYHDVKIHCGTHGYFLQSPSNHLSGHGCPACGGNERMSTDSYIARAEDVHKGRYLYQNTVYVNILKPILVTCRIHGDFSQVASHHLKGHGCAKCAGVAKLEANEFESRALSVHDGRYCYGKSVYVSYFEKVDIHCDKHGYFSQTPAAHLQGQGCPSCDFDRSQPTAIYLMQMGAQVKIGISIDPSARLAQLNRNNPKPAHIITTWLLDDFPTAHAMEQRIHRKLAKYHAGLSGFDGATEWFNASPDTAKKHILDAIRGSHVVKNYVKNNPQMSLI